MCTLLKVSYRCRCTCNHCEGRGCVGIVQRLSAGSAAHFTRSHPGDRVCVAHPLNILFLSNSLLIVGYEINNNIQFAVYEKMKVFAVGPSSNGEVLYPSQRFKKRVSAFFKIDF